MKYGILGCGLIGKKRALCLSKEELVAAFDPAPGAAASFVAAFPDCKMEASAAALLARPEIDAVFVCTSHEHLAGLGAAALKAKKHVLIEKPGARNFEELEALVALARESKRLVKIGFNHRFHPALLKAKELLDSGRLGPLMFLRGRYGHGARPGYEKEWRAQKEISGGGELIDQGVHLIDLSRLFLGDLEAAAAYLPTYFWKMQVEDNAFMLLKSPSGQAAWLHASWTEWKNKFSLEIYGRDAKLQIEGLGGSYGEESLTLYQMKPEMGPPDVERFHFPGSDLSWQREFENFAGAIEGRSVLNGSLEDGLAALKITADLYRLPESSRL